MRQNYSDFDASHQNDQNAIFWGGLGDDILKGGDDTLDGGAGMTSFLTVMYINGGQGDDILTGDLAKTSLFGKEGN